MKLKDLFVPRWAHSNPIVRIKAVNKIFNPLLLKNISEQDEDPMVRETALSRLISLEEQKVKVTESE